MFLYNKEGKYIIEVSQGTDEEIRVQYGNDIFILDDYVGEYGIVENGEIRGETRLDRILNGKEELQPGEYIKGNEIISTVKPDGYHYWDNKKNKWLYDKNLEIDSLYKVTAGLEQQVQDLEKELKETEANNRRALKRELTEKIKTLNEQIDINYKRLDELEG